MRNRTIKKQFWLNQTEEKLLKEKSKKAGLSEAEFIRSFINDYKLKEKPDENFYYVLKDLRGMATNVNQLARQANRYQYVDSNKFFAIADKISDFIIAIQETYLTPARKD
ncbi:MAG: plasmid mobilization protein [Clostridia bacterium]